MTRLGSNFAPVRAGIKMEGLLIFSSLSPRSISKSEFAFCELFPPCAAIFTFGIGGGRGLNYFDYL